MKRWLPFLLYCLLTAVVPITAAQSNPPTVHTNELDASNYPWSVTFRLTLDDPSAVQQAILTYQIDKFSCLDAATDVVVDLAADELTWTWEMVRSGNPPPGTAVTWQWTLTDKQGQTHTTPAQTQTFTDGRYQWQTVTSGQLNLHWYQGDVGQPLLDIALSGLAELEEEMGIVLQDEVNIFIYANTQDMRDAVLYIQDWAGGVAFTAYNAILIGIAPSQVNSWGRDVLPHELAHLVIAQFGRSCVGGSRPTWLDEGLAVHAEGEPSAQITADIERAIANDSFEPLRSLNGAFSAHGPEAGIAYSQSYSVVDYLLTSYGREAMQQLLLTLADGVGTDAALEAVYGFNVDGLEQAWRADLGLAPRQIPPTPTAIDPAAIATIPPQGLPQTVATPPAAAATAVAPPSPSGPTAGICNAAAMPLLLLGWFAGRKRRKIKK